MLDEGQAEAQKPDSLDTYREDQDLSLPAHTHPIGFKPGDRRGRSIMIYAEIYTVIAKRCLDLGNISMTEYVNRALAKTLSIPFRPRARRSYLPNSILPETPVGIFKLLDLTPLGYPRKKAP